jgi:hypothetical protein
MVWPFSRRATTSPTASQKSAQGCVALQLETEGMPEIWFVDATLSDFAERVSYPWHLSLTVQLEDVHAGVGIPTPGEQKLATRIRDELEARLTVNGNARFLASITWNGTRQLLYRVRDPEAANAVLRGVVDDPAAPRAMEYRMNEDVAWEQADIYLDAVRAAAKGGVPIGRVIREDGRIKVVEA